MPAAIFGEVARWQDVGVAGDARGFAQPRDVCAVGAAPVMAVGRLAGEQHASFDWLGERLKGGRRPADGDVGVRPEREWIAVPGGALDCHRVGRTLVEDVSEHVENPFARLILAPTLNRTPL